MTVDRGSPATMWPPHATDDQVRAAARAVLRGSPYAGWQRMDAMRAWFEHIREWLRWFNDRMLDLSTARPLLYWLIIGGMLLAVALLLAHAVWSLRAALAVATPPRPPRVGDDGGAFAAEARALARQGRFLEAARRLQLAALDLLLRDRTISLSRFEPNRVLRRRLAQAQLPEVERRALLALIDRLETAWFRDRVDDAALYQSWNTLYERMSQHAGGA